MTEKKSNNSKIYIIDLMQEKRVFNKQLYLDENKFLNPKKFKPSKELILSILKKILSVELNKSSVDLHFTKNVYGKPYLKNNDRHFSISYSDGIVAIVTDNTPVGVDLEKIVPIEEIDDLIKHFSKVEQLSYYEQEQDKRVEYFYTLWTLNEAYIKAIGLGLSCSLDTFSICFYNDTPYLENPIEGDGSWYFHTYDINIEGFYKCSLCKRTPIFQEQPCLMEINELFSGDH